jgi:hypothetical protein
MRKSLLTLIVVGTLASGATPGFAAENTQQQRVERYAAMPNGMNGVAAQEAFFNPYLSNPPSATKRSGCSAGSAKDVVASKNWRDRCE